MWWVGKNWRETSTSECLLPTTTKTHLVALVEWTRQQRREPGLLKKTCGPAEQKEEKEKFAHHRRIGSWFRRISSKCHDARRRLTCRRPLELESGEAPPEPTRTRLTLVHLSVWDLLSSPRCQRVSFFHWPHPQNQERAFHSLSQAGLLIKFYGRTRVPVLMRYRCGRPEFLFAVPLPSIYKCQFTSVNLEADSNK